MEIKNKKFVFFGTEPLAEKTLEALSEHNFIPDLIVASRLTPELISNLAKSDWDFFVVASYGQILPKDILDMPRLGTINIHPSLLPKLRGPSPIRSAILNDEKETGVSIMLIDEKMDHGPILALRKIDIKNWPPSGKDLDSILASEGGKLLAEVLPKYLAGEITAKEQDHSQATYTKMFKKEDGEINLADDSYKNFLKFQAFDGWPGVFFFAQSGSKKIRVKITDAEFQNGIFVVKKVIPEGKKEMSLESFKRGYNFI